MPPLSALSLCCCSGSAWRTQEAAPQAKTHPPPREARSSGPGAAHSGSQVRRLDRGAGRLDDLDVVSARMEQCQREGLTLIDKNPTAFKALRPIFENYLATTLSFRADAAENRDDLDAALAARREILEIKSRLLGEENWEVADARRDLAAVERNRRAHAVRTPAAH